MDPWTLPSSIPQYVADRVRQPLPAESWVVPRSTPVVSFGNAQQASVATVGLNPSRREFADAHGHQLPERERRLSTLDSLELDDLSTASDNQVTEVVSDCYGYFERNPYLTWFNHLEALLSAVAGRVVLRRVGLSSRSCSGPDRPGVAEASDIGQETTGQGGP